MGIVAVYVWMKAAVSRLPGMVVKGTLDDRAGQINQIAVWTVVGLGAWWINGMLLRALSYYAQVALWPETLWASRLIQATFAIVWTLVALLGMVYAVRIASRALWFTGASVLGVVIIKLLW